MKKAKKAKRANKLERIKKIEISIFFYQIIDFIFIHFASKPIPTQPIFQLYFLLIYPNYKSYLKLIIAQSPLYYTLYIVYTLTTSIL